MSKNDLISVVVVGSGNVAEAFAVAVAECWGLELRQIVARNAERAAEIAEMARCEWTSDFEQSADADFYIIAVSDRAVEEVAGKLRHAEQAIILHTAGSVSHKALGEKSCGVLYPFQTFTRGRRVEFEDVPLFIEGCDEQVTQRIEELANMLSHRVYFADSAQRREVHLTGVLACNFVNALYAMAADRLAEKNLPFDVLCALIEETARKAVEAEHPRNVQTGPAVRGDRAVAERHIAMLEGEELQQRIYTLLNEYIFSTREKQ